MLNNLFKWTGSIIKLLFIKILSEQVQEQRNYIWSLEHLEECVWRTASEETGLKKSSWRHVIRSKVIRSNGYQKHISSEATSPELTKDNVQSVRPRTLQPPSLQSLSLQQDKDNSNIAADVVPLVLEWIWN